ncbi:Na+/H+ antiporter NhaA [Chelatococcus asaccharovorans]|uniref:Na(+)/H(+) antiporter NhaA n=1 Tax=Chelatococcus asaccharovorans TaxID=28210 RepID=A0A2V3U5P9_9HYPH|nr:Na+/H+ antiporter NhaA [Chelatococcus asaccharovorans]MBS7702926.1 Na+/H+ antiporter NhaA [Chelatococcus asaccharovorans]PXW57226.1 sodium/proton antiporter (NhaA family) [Chelatococcus asaccharovorans]
MVQKAATRTPTRAQMLAERAAASIERFIHIEATSGVVLMVAAAIALAWANSPLAHSYHALWHLPVTLGLGDYVFERSLHFWINDALMTVFFLVVGMEIRREIHEGALSDVRQAALPIMAAIGGVVVPAIIYVVLVGQGEVLRGWAVPTATDIAFAVGVLALLGKSIPSNVRIFLLALAIIDDIIAVLIIAVFYSGSLEPAGLFISMGGVALVLLMQWIGVANAYAYVVPAAVLWAGLLYTGAHPTLAGVVLGLMTPVHVARSRERPLDMAMKAINDIVALRQAPSHADNGLAPSLKTLRRAQRDLLPPVTRVQMALHPWVAFGVMPLFALANAGVSLDGVDLDAPGAVSVLLGVLLALVVGKPVGVLAVSWLAVKLRLCRMPAGIDMAGLALIGLLAGIGFTMSIFIATLAFADDNLLNAAKLGVLVASVIAATAGLAWGRIAMGRR